MQVFYDKIDGAASEAPAGSPGSAEAPRHTGGLISG